MTILRDILLSLWGDLVVWIVSNELVLVPALSLLFAAVVRLDQSQA